MRKKKHYSTKLNKKSIKSLFLILFFILFLFTIYFIFSTSDTSNIKETNTITILNYTIDIRNTSLFLASVIIGLLDGFNPCAMWVLIYLISLVSTLEDKKKKLILIVGTFVFTESIMYYLVLAGWLNLFEIIGYSKWILYAVGIFAIYMGAKTINDYIKNKGKVECEIGDLESKKKTMNKIQYIVHSPITIGTILATIILAIVINSIEFICSAGLPAIYTQMLAISNISTFMKYVYIGIYDLFFMIDDFIIFGIAFYAINSPLLDKYSGLSKILGGIIMLIIGILLLFFPQFLM